MNTMNYYKFIKNNVIYANYEIIDFRAEDCFFEVRKMRKNREVATIKYSDIKKYFLLGNYFDYLIDFNIPAVKFWNEKKKLWTLEVYIDEAMKKLLFKIEKPYLCRIIR